MPKRTYLVGMVCALGLLGGCDASLVDADGKGTPAGDASSSPSSSQPPGPGVGPPAGTEPGRLAGVTAAHNGYRQAKGLPPLTWDPQIAAVAQAYAQTMSRDCRFEHSGGAYGENLYASYPQGTATGEKAVHSWMSEEPWYDYATNSCSPPPDESCGHYTQVLWRSTARVGCGLAACANGTWDFVVCNYDPPGNFIGQRPY